MNSAPDDIPDKKEIRLLLQELADKRSTKIRTGLKRVSEESWGIKINNFGAIELNRIRSFTSHALDQIVQGNLEYHGVEADIKKRAMEDS